MLLGICFSLSGIAQELNAKVMVNADQLTGVERKIFKTMQNDLQTFLNTRKWGQDAFDQKERIECTFNIILDKVIDGVEGGYLGRISIQSSRPVYGTNYNAPMINYVDKDFAFKYIEFQPMDFNDNMVTGNDPLISNLTATIAYYAYFIIGMDYDSFSPKGGTEFYNRALNIVNNAPENRAISGWKAGENQKNRYWLIDQMLNSRFAPVRDAIYKYHIQGLDILKTEPEVARANIYSTFNSMLQINNENPASMLILFFFNGKSDEIQKLLSQASMQDKQVYIPIVSQMDVSNAGKYAELLK